MEHRIDTGKGDNQCIEARYRLRKELVTPTALQRILVFFFSRFTGRLVEISYTTPLIKFRFNSFWISRQFSVTQDLPSVKTRVF